MSTRQEKSRSGRVKLAEIRALAAKGIRILHLRDGWHLEIEGITQDAAHKTQWLAFQAAPMSSRPTTGDGGASGYVALVVDGKDGPRTYIHAPSCRLVLNARNRTHAHPCGAPGDSPEQAAKKWDADYDTLERGLPATCVCKCAKAGERAKTK